MLLTWIVGMAMILKLIFHIKGLMESVLLLV